MGPSSLLNLPNNIWLFLLGLGLTDAALGLFFIPIFPEIIEAFSARYGFQEGHDDQLDEDISDLASGIYGSFYYTGMILSPIGGSLVYQHYKNFNQTCDVFALLAIAYSFIYY
jgi:MFS family permease